MTYKPTREFTADEGDLSVGLSGPDTIEKDFDKINKMFDPASTHDNQEPGGIGTGNIQSGASTDDIVGDRTIDDNITDTFSNTGKLTILLSFIAKMIKTITGKTNWFDTPVDTIEGLHNRINTNNTNLQDQISSNDNDITNIQNNKADKIDTYTKTEVDNKVWNTSNYAAESVTPAILSPEAKSVMEESAQTVMLHDHEERITNNKNGIDSNVNSINNLATDMAELVQKKNYEVTITDSNGIQLQHYTAKTDKLFFEVAEPQNINVKNLDGKAFVKTSLDMTWLTEGQVSVDYDNKNVGFYDNGIEINEKVASSGIDVKVLDKGFVLENASYDNIVFSVAGEETIPSSIAFNNDGSKLFMIGVISDSIYQYSLSKPYDLNTISYDNISFSVTNEDGNPYSITFNNDGTKLYMIGADNDSIYQYSLSMPFDLNTISYDNISYSISSEETAPRSITFNDDGSKLFMIGEISDLIHQYSLSKPYDLNTISYDNISFNVNSEDAKPTSFTFNNDGSKLFILGNGTNSIYQYSLSMPFDLKTISYDNISYSIVSQDTSPHSLTFNNDGSKLFMIGATSESIHQYSTTSPYNGTTYIGVEY